jgi:hypothetical protein
MRRYRIHTFRFLIGHHYDFGDLQLLGSHPPVLRGPCSPGLVGPQPSSKRKARWTHFQGGLPSANVPSSTINRHRGTTRVPLTRKPP